MTKKQSGCFLEHCVYHNISWARTFASIGNAYVNRRFNINITFNLFIVALCNRADHIYFHPVVCYGRPM